MSKWQTLADIRREYGNLTLTEEEALESPIEQFELWFAEVLKSEKSDPTAMVLSTVDERNIPDSRIVLLKEIDKGNFVFFTNYLSAKAVQIRKNPYVALNFYWPETARQVRVRGRVKETSKVKSDAYFASRPLPNQLSALISPQSEEITSREELEKRLNDLIESEQKDPIVRPVHWGGYEVIPDEIEFWQGRDNRLHDRIHYFHENGKWVHRRLAP
ncbi:pyridoxamine 5'-phosphate oxidase (plasmid) [Legionella adelaidensis]|uniref:Pyridoxine/pyridoxamine 5'-phosphate oxidase n=1 Tax=Legionella adelaidensis TaxID=45056 RepID=A0A0W0R5Z8_9GAMM|nr:pyridoxamine 5'-phosphate oxidase [Legionella adelaidensis]KTC66455.1 pyridoxamine 5'-phosphate oxidase [Legionella adelaidensis]VEH86257.1 pyridoxamine 5'-phosphate oxidase [Legionella adelaidensis]